MQESQQCFDINNGPSEIEFLADMVSGNGETEFVGVTRAITLRLPITLYATVKAMAENSKGQSMNTVVEQMVRVAIDQLEEQLPINVKCELEDLRSKIMQAELSKEAK